MRMTLACGVVETLQNVGGHLVHHPGFGGMHHRPPPGLLRRQPVRGACPDLPVRADPRAYADAAGAASATDLPPQKVSPSNWPLRL